MSNFTNEIKKRRTFAIISHPDAGKTTLTEKFLLYGGAINQAGSVKGKATAKHAVSDWMEIEKERGISVTSSVLQFEYGGYCINILDTPGHQDFSEDTYRTLMAADSAVMVIDGSKGVEAQTRKLFKVCVMRHIPIFTFINKMDREAMDTFELLDDIEKELGIATCPVNWPIGSGKEFRGVFDRNTEELEIFSDTKKGTAMGAVRKVSIHSNEAKEIVTPEQYAQLEEEIELLDGASAEFDQERVNKGELSPVFFGSALTNFGVETFLQHFLKMTTSPLPRMSDKGEIDPMKEEAFSAFVFKIQANMNKAHRDRIAFMRICSGKFEAGMEVNHVQGGKKIRLTQPQQLMAQDRKIVEEAYAGDIIGVFDPGIFSIGDTLCDPENIRPLPMIRIEEPTLSMNFMVNTSPFAGQSGKYVTSRNIRERLEKELEVNVGLKVEETDTTDCFKVSGRGELHLSVLLENMRREGYEVAVSKPEVIMHKVDGALYEPVEEVVCSVPNEYSGTVISKLNLRKGIMVDIQDEGSYTRILYTVPTRGLLGYRSEFINDTRGEGTMVRRLAGYEAYKGDIPQRANGALISTETGKAMTYALWNIQERGQLFVSPQTEVYEGMIIGMSARNMDMDVNPLKNKKMTAVRSTGNDEAMKLVPPKIMSLEEALEFINDDELVELTPTDIRIRKKYLTALERRQHMRELNKAAAELEEE